VGGRSLAFPNRSVLSEVHHRQREQDPFVGGVEKEPFVGGVDDIYTMQEDPIV
jgi:hypothetical protein